MPISNISGSSVAPAISSNPLAIGTGGPKWYDNSGVLEAKNSAESALVKVRCLDGAASTDAVTYAQLTALAGTTGSTFQVNSDATGPKLKDNSGVLQVRNSADSAFVTVEVDTPTTSGHAATKGYVDALASTSSSTFTLGSSGPKLKNSSGVVEIRNNADAAYAIVRGDTAVGASDLVPLAQFQAVSGTTASTFQLDTDSTGPKIKNNSNVIEFRNNADDAMVIARGLTPVGSTDLTTKAYVDGKIATFTSSNQTIGAGTTDTIAHGLSGVPQVIQVLLENDTDEAGYVDGDVLDITASCAAASNRGIQVQVNATNIILVYGSDAQSISILNKGTGALTAITNANWHINVKAIYFS